MKVLLTILSLIIYSSFSSDFSAQAAHKIQVDWTFRVQNPLDANDSKIISKAGLFEMAHTTEIYSGNFFSGGHYHYIKYQSALLLQDGEFDIPVEAIDGQGQSARFWYGYEKSYGAVEYRISLGLPSFMPGQKILFAVDPLVIPTWLGVENFEPASVDSLRVSIAGVAGNVRLPITYNTKWILGSIKAQDGSGKVWRLYLDKFTLTQK